MSLRLIVLPLIMVIFVNCNFKPSPQSSPNMESNKQEEITKTELPDTGLADEHKIESPLYRTYDVGSKTIAPNAMAIYVDGTIYRYSDAIISFENGKMKTEKADLEWRKEISITEKGVSSIKNLLDEFDDNEESSSKASIGQDPPTEITFMINDVEKTILLDGQTTPKNYMIFTKINQEISRATIMK